MKKLGLVSVVLALSACAGTFEPIVDTGLPAPAARTLEADTADCRGFAAQVGVLETAGGDLADGAVSGAGIGAVIGAALTGPLFPIGAGAGAGLGAAAGVGTQLTKAVRDHLAEQAMVERNCLKGRGWAVLN